MSRKSKPRKPSDDDLTPHPDALIAVGIVRKAHGVRGEASTEPLTSSLDRFTELDRVYLVSPARDVIRRVHVKGARIHGPRALVQFDEIGSPEELRACQNWTIEVPEEEARELEDDEYFVHDLLGMALVSPAGERLGEVTDVNDAGGGLLLEVQGPEGKKFDVPFVAALCTKVDLEKKEITAELPEGLTDLDTVDAAGEEGTKKRRGTTRGEQAVSPLPQPVAPQGEPRLDAPVITFDLVTIFPDMFAPLMSEGILGRAIRRNIVEVKSRDLRDFTRDRHRSTDDEAYGGGSGMVMLAEPVFRCVEQIERERRTKPWVVAMSPQGKPFTQRTARELAARPHIAILCGRYEGFDHRVMSIVDEEVSIGDFVVTGGELPAMLVVDAVSRMIDGVVGQRNSVEADSFYNGLLDYPHYTRPAELRGMRVPEVLLSGHFEKIRRWRKEASLKATLEKRPDLLDRAELDDEANEILAGLRGEPLPERKRKKALNKSPK